METFCDDEDAKEKTLNLITHVHVEPAHNSDANALMPAIESAKQRGLMPEELLADSLYGSDDNSQRAAQEGVDLIAPTMGASKKDNLSLVDFEVSEKNQILACPRGNVPVTTKTKKQRVTVAFASDPCKICPQREQCPVKEGKKFFYLRYTKKEMRIAKRRAYEQTDRFKDRYRWRSGVEATMSEYDRKTGVKRLRVRGLKAVRYCATLKAAGVNIMRAAAAQLCRIVPEEVAYAA
jgi:Transposase DDE domain